MAGKAKVKATRRKQPLGRSAAQPPQRVRRRPAAKRRLVKVKQHARGMRAVGLSYKKAKAIQVKEHGVCNRCGELCVHCKATDIVKLKQETRSENGPPGDSRKYLDGEVNPKEDSVARSSSLERDLADIIDEDIGRRRRLWGE